MALLPSTVVSMRSIWWILASFAREQVLVMATALASLCAGAVAGHSDSAVRATEAALDRKLKAAAAAAGPSLASSGQAQVLDLAAADLPRPPEDPPPVDLFRKVVTMLRELESLRARGHVGRAEFVTLRAQIQGQATRLAAELPGGAPRSEEARRHERR